MSYNNQNVNRNELPDAFADFFQSKVENIVNNQIINDQVYNGKKRVDTQTLNFMSENEVLKAIKSLKPKNCEGHDRIPVRVIFDGIVHLLKPLSYLFTKINIQKQIPEMVNFKSNTLT